MVEFEQIFGSRLFVSGDNLAGAGWWGFLVAEGLDPPADSVPLDRALEDQSLGGSFVYAATSPVLATQDQTTAFVASLDAIVAGSGRAVVWLPSGATGSISPSTALFQTLTASSRGIATNSGFDASLTGTVADVTASTNAGAMVTVADDGSALLFSGSALPPITLGGPSAPALVQPDNSARLLFTGPSQGCFAFTLSIQRRALYTNLAWGFQLLVPGDASRTASPAATDGIAYLDAWLPLADGDTPNPTDYVGFALEINVVNPNNLVDASRTVFYFTGKNDPGAAEPETRLVSYYRTAFGAGVSLYPAPGGVDGALQAGLVPTTGYLRTPLYNGFSFAPVGDFFLGVDTPSSGDLELLLCGLSGSETVSFLARTDAQPSAGSRVRFWGGQAAYVPQFPLPQASPVGPPIDPAASLMTTSFQTSWANLIGAPGSGDLAHYAAAPNGADPFGKPADGTGQDDGLLVPRDPGVALPDGDLCFPLLPFAGFKPGAGDQDLTSAEVELLERQIVCPTRRARITAASPQRSPSAMATARRRGALGDEAPFNTTTPAGLIARVDGGAWSRLLLAQVMDGGEVTRQLGFTSLLPDLQAAFQTDNLFLVVANGKLLGTRTEGVMPEAPAPGAPPAFYSVINIDEWVFDAAVGNGSAYGDYRNVMIVKGVPGKLVDLVTSPDKWTQKDRFAAPSVTNADGSTGEPDVSQLVPLSAWLSSYFSDALANQDSPYFQGFCRIIQDDAWQGVLFLRVDLRAIPKDLLGVLAGVSDMSSFCAHHLGAEISQIDGATVQQVDSSSLFGLVDYVDPSYDDSGAPHPITPSDMTAPYEFTVLTLKALFQNTAVQKFESVAQVVLNDLFGSRVSEMGAGGNDFNAVLLQGAYQMNGSAPVYALSAAAPSTFLLENNVLLSVEIATADMSTRDDGSVSGEVVSWIAMSGAMSFTIVTAEGEPDFDIFSFGDASGAAGSADGLAFGALGLRIAYPADAPQKTTPTLEEGEISFDVAASQARAKSLFKNFQLELRGLASGDETSAPESLGYLTVATPYGLQGVQARRWHGLALRANMGTPGALAGKINLTATLLVAWADDSGAPGTGSGLAVTVGLQLPGTGPAGELFSLQSVIKVSVGVIRLLYNEEQSSFLLLMNEIALKFLGLLKIPSNGATSFFLFGNPGATDPTGLGWYAIYNQDAPKP